MKSLTTDQLQQLDCPDCLRPQKTRFLLEDLLIKGQSINLVGKAGHGRQRTCEDVARIAALFCQVWMVDLKPHRSSYASLVKEMSRYVGGKRNFKRIEEVFDRASRDQPLLLILDNLEYLGEDHAASQKDSLDPLYDRHFLAFLNNLKNSRQPKVQLLIPSETPWKNIRMDGMYSSLELSPVQLGELQQAEIRQEMNRLLSAEWVDYFENQAAYARDLIKTVHKHPMAYGLLRHLCEHLVRNQDPDVPFVRRIKGWQKDFERLNAPNLKRKLERGKKQAQGHLKASGLSFSMLNPIGWIKQLFGKDD